MAKTEVMHAGVEKCRDAHDVSSGAARGSRLDQIEAELAALERLYDESGLEWTGLTESAWNGLERTGLETFILFWTGVE